MKTPIIYDYSKSGKRAYSLPELEPEEENFRPEEEIDRELLRKEPPALPEVTEPEIARHYTELAKRNYGVDTGFYPLGSCTMKYNPKVSESLSKLDGFLNLHPMAPQSMSQGSLQIIYEISEYLAEITGLDKVCPAPAAGAHGELLGLLLIRAYFKAHGQLNKRNKILIPDSAHGTNPASVSLAGFKPVTVKSNSGGMISLDDLKDKLDSGVAALMLTNPNTLGIFESEIIKINKLLKDNGSFSYCDGANLNALLGISRPGDVGFDIVHINLHKTFGAPHGGGGPGSGPVAIRNTFKEYLPVPEIKKENNNYYLDYHLPESIGKIHTFYGQFSVILKSYIYIRMLGSKGLLQSSKLAVLNSNYLAKRIESFLPKAYNSPVLHEFVATAENYKQQYGVRAFDIAKALLDEGFHAPTMYFPLIVNEALMIEPTETESKSTLDNFANTLKRIVEKASERPESIKRQPQKTPIKRIDEAKAARELILKWQQK